MKTLTEFFATSLKNAQQAKEALLAAGKTAEELTAAMGESLKLEGDKLNHMISALDAVESRWQDLKRVIVLSLNEGEKAPSNAKQNGLFAFVVEHYAPLNQKKPQAREERGSGRGKRDGRGGGRGGKGGGREGRGGDKRGPRKDSASGNPS